MFNSGIRSTATMADMQHATILTFVAPQSLRLEPREGSAIHPGLTLYPNASVYMRKDVAPVQTDDLYQMVMVPSTGLTGWLRANLLQTAQENYAASAPPAGAVALRPAYAPPPPSTTSLVPQVPARYSGPVPAAQPPSYGAGAAYGSSHSRAQSLSSMGSRVSFQGARPAQGEVCVLAVTDSQRRGSV